MLMRSFFRHKRDAAASEAPLLEFVAAEHAVDQVQTARDKAEMEANIVAACANTSFHSPAHDEPST